MKVPETVAELYESASDAMLARAGGGASNEVRALLQAVFFEAHVCRRRIIEDWQLDVAALDLGGPGCRKNLAAIRARAYSSKACSFTPGGSFVELGHYVEVQGKRGVISKIDHGKGNGDRPYHVTFFDGSQGVWVSDLLTSGMDQASFFIYAMNSDHELDLPKDLTAACLMLPEGLKNALAEVRRRVARDELPMLSLLQIEPLQMQSSHLSFQEYYAARSICEGMGQGSQPWQWPVWWTNAVVIGEGMGDKFSFGLLRASGAKQAKSQTLDLGGKLIVETQDQKGSSDANGKSSSVGPQSWSKRPVWLRVVCQLMNVLNGINILKLIVQ